MSKVKAVQNVSSVRALNTLVREVHNNLPSTHTRRFVRRFTKAARKQIGTLKGKPDNVTFRRLREIESFV